MTALLGLLSPLGALLRPLAPYLIAAGLGIAVIVGAYQTGVRAERKRGEAAALRAELATVRADLAIARQAAADGEVRAAAIAAQSAADNRIVEEVRNAPRPNSCRLSPADAGRLQSIGAGRAGRP